MKTPPPAGADPRRSPELPTPLPDGVLLIDKPDGMTSHDVVDRIRRFVRPMKVGHTGTLDPFATGLLPLCLGRATRLSRFLSLSDKIYEGTIELGVRTATYDRDGEILSRAEVPPDWRERVTSILRRFHGTVRLTPPPFSAKKVMGKPLYEFARADIHIKRKPVESRIYEIEPIGFLDRAFRFRAEVSAGTYLRSLADAIGVEIGCGAHLKELRRLGAGGLTLDRALPLESLEEEIGSDPQATGRRVMPLQDIPLGLETLVLNARGRAAVLNGRRFGPSGLERGAGAFQGPQFRVIDGGSGALLGIAEAIGGPGGRPRALWRPVLVFPPREAERSPARNEVGDGSHPFGAQDRSSG